MAVLLKWQQQFIAHVTLLSNKELLDEIFDEAGGDDYDGDFTSRGWWKFSYLRGELERRLASWLKEDK